MPSGLTAVRRMRQAVSELSATHVDLDDASIPAGGLTSDDIDPFACVPIDPSITVLSADRSGDVVE